ncbi:fructose-1,6-bisphosphatase [Lactococcus sp. LG606]|uniref:fructose-1,6-bisphosphatase n=1 Tax=Lactococcus sp. LG606 TaxID=2816912 RepID=UPI001A8F29ED|nr:fructose-1,6-bisphosphatase [Lactococcus sp. LG606]QSR11918.1 fructose-1,6-bisphosphatase [Lactococcus sp. LG606]
MDEKYYKLLKEQFVSKEAVLTEIINLSAICELPKGTEHFVSDIHGEYDAFNHVLRNGSGSIKEKLRECFPDLDSTEISELATLIYYPEEKLVSKESQLSQDAFAYYCRENLISLLKLARFAGKKYTRSKVRKAFPEKFRYILEELKHEVESSSEKRAYFDSIIEKLQHLGELPNLIIALADSVRRLTVDHLHVVGDIYDRGPFPDKIIDRLISMPSVDVQWGNHDIIWMAAIAGSPLAMMNVIRISSRYGNLDILEDSYGINLRPLIEYAERYYEPSPAFAPRLTEGEYLSQEECDLLNKLQQATAILQFKLESQLIARRPDFHLEERDVLHFINYDEERITLKGKQYDLQEFQAPTVDPVQPEQLTDEEEILLKKLLKNFQASQKLKKHIDFLLEKGSMYLSYNGNLLIHGCLPLHENGDFKCFRLEGEAYSGRELLDLFEDHVRKSLAHPDVKEDLSTDLLWYLWVGESSSLFGKEAMTTFERYYISDKATHVEKKNPYYRLREEPETISRILKNFGMDEKGHVINGHTPVKEKKGEEPIKAGGKLIVIDGGFSKPYQKETGIAGYTLLYNSYGMQLAAHEPFKTIKAAVEDGSDIVSVKRLVDRVEERTCVKDTNIGQELLKTIDDLEYLFENYEKY